MKAIDLHIHSTYSDGAHTPSELIEMAHVSGLQAIAITDHDTTAGINEAMAHGHTLGIEVISGVEVSAEYDGHPMHILGYNFAQNDNLLQQRLRILQDARHQRNLKIFAKLQELGFDVDIAEIPDAPGQVGRPHIARLLVQKKIVKNMDQAFAKLLRRSAAAYVQCYRMDAKEVIAMIKEAGGLAFLAHPTANDRQLKTIPQNLPELQKLGLDGIELFYPTHTPKTHAKLHKLGEKLGLMFSGGSDFHGDDKPHIKLGRWPNGQPIPYELFTAIRDRAIND